MLGGCKGGSIGFYLASLGIDVIREDIVKYIFERDGISSKLEDIMLCIGVSDGIKIILVMLMIGKLGKERVGILIFVF